MSRLAFRLQPIPAASGSVVRIDTASGSNTPADLRTLGGNAIDGAVIRSGSNGGHLPTILGPDGVTTLYQKTLDYRGQVTGSPITLTGEDDSPGSPSTSGIFTPAYADSFTPANWGSLAWRPKLAQARAGTGKAVVAIHGDSVGRGYHASNLDTTSWAGRLATTLRTGADGGSGFKSVFDSTVFMAARSLPAAMQTAYTNNGTLIGLTGTWTEFSGPSGPGGAQLQSTVASSTATFTVRGTSGNIYWQGSSSGPGFEYQVDGGGFTVVPTTSFQQNKTALPAMSAGTHTVVIRYPAGGTGTLYLNGVSAENATGVVVNQFSRYGATSLTYDTTDGVATGDWNGGQKYPCDLLIYAIGLNDNGGGTASDTSMLNAARVLRSARDKNSRNGDVDILVVINHCGSYNTSPNDKYHEFALKLRQLAVSHHAAYVDLWAAGRNSYNYWNSLGYWGNNTSPGAAGTDGVHLSDAGHLAAYNAIVGAVPALIA